MADSKYSQRIPSGTWNKHKHTILRLYLSEKKPLMAAGGVRETMISEHGFSATKSQYETRLKKWGCYKYTAAHDRRFQAPVPDCQRAEGLITERHTTLPSADAPTSTSSFSQDIPIRGSSPHRSTLQLSPRNRLFAGIRSSPLTDECHNISSLSMRSSNLQSSISPKEVQLLISQDAPWTPNATANDPFHAAIHTCVNENTTSSSSGVLYNMEPPGNFDSLLLPPNAMYAGSFNRENDIRVLNMYNFSDDFALCGRIQSDGLPLPDFATSMFTVISHMFPRAVSSPQLVPFENSSAFDSALRNMSQPSTLQLVQQQSIDYQVIYMVFHRLINDRDAVWKLDDPETEVDRLFRKGVIYCFSLGKHGLSNLFDYTPSSFILALMQSIFFAALVLDNGPILNYVLEMNQGSFANQRFLLLDEVYYPLEYAALVGHIEALQALLDHGADSNQPANYHDDGVARYEFLDTIFGPSWDEKDPQVGVQIFRLLIDHGLKFKPVEAVRKMSDCSGDAMMVIATHCLDKSFKTFFYYDGLTTVLLRREWDDPSSELLKAILNQALSESHPQEDVCDTVLTLSLSAAILRSHVSAVDVLLSVGAIPDTHCLISAAQVNNVQILEDFLSRGLDANARASNFGLPGWDRSEDCTALSESILKRSRAAFDVLREQGFVSRLSHQPAGFASAFVAACEVGDSAIIEQLLSMPNFPRRDAKLNEAIEAAMEGDQYCIIDKLLSAGMKPNPESLRLAIQKEQLTSVILLTRYMDNLEGTTERPIEQTNVIFWEALRWGNQTVIERVLKLGQRVDVDNIMVQGKLRDWKLLPALQPPRPSKLWRYTPLGAAILARNISVVKTLMTYGVEAVSFKAHHTSYKPGGERGPYRNEWILTPLAAAAVVNDLPLIREFLRIGADPFDNSALFVCAMIDSEEEVVALLLSAFKTRYPDGARSFGSDALFRAMRRRNVRLFKLLAKDVDLISPVEEDREVNTDESFRPQYNTIFTSPLGEAVRFHAENEDAGGVLDHCLPLVKDLDAIVQNTYKHGNLTALLYAISLDSLATFRKIHQAGGNISLPAEWQVTRTPLQAASEAGCQDIVEYLLQEGADPNQPPAARAGATALQLAAITGNIGIAAILLEHGALINAPPAPCDGRTAFEGATEHGRIEMMIFLVSKGADLLSNENLQYRRAVGFAKDNLQHGARKLADELYAKALAKHAAMFIDTGADTWYGPSMGSFGSFPS